MGLRHGELLCRELIGHSSQRPGSDPGSAGRRQIATGVVRYAHAELTRLSYSATSARIGKFLPSELVTLRSEQGRAQVGVHDESRRTPNSAGSPNCTRTICRKRPASRRGGLSGYDLEQRPSLPWSHSSSLPGAVRWLTRSGRSLGTSTRQASAVRPDRPRGRQGRDPPLPPSRPAGRQGQVRYPTSDSTL